MKRSIWLITLFLFVPIFCLADTLAPLGFGPFDKGTFTFVMGDSKFDFAFRLVLPEWFAGKNTVLLNNANEEDRIFFIRHTIDTSFHYGYGKNCFNHEIVQLHMNMRDRGIWGNPESIASTTSNTIKAYEVRFGDHSHALPRHIWWIRELWVDLDINNVLGLSFDNDHFVTIGAFSFKLGRGIALGDAYQVTPDPILGFSVEGAVDQYAFGGKFYGDIIPHVLGYDLYGAIINNKADSFSNTGAKIRGNEFGKKFNPFREFGVVNFILAGKLRYTPPTGEYADVYVEPYWFYNNDPEQRVEFLGDATSKLGTVGIAGEFRVGRVEFGFDTAFNLGRQLVKGIDRNIIVQKNDKGFLSIVNSSVDLVLNPGTALESKQKLPYRLQVVDQEGATIDVQSVVDQAFENASENGRVILENVTLDNVLVTDDLNPVPARIVNGKDRFRNPYKNEYDGSMFIADASYWLYKRDLKIAGALGFATGDANPNRDLQFPGDSNEDRVFSGFIPFQEFYAGTRVRSVFFLSGAGRIPRLVDFPSEQTNSKFASTVQRFTNIVFIGASLWYLPSESEHNLDINPNILCYWQEFQTRRFSSKEAHFGCERTSAYLGLEANVFFNVEPVKDLRFFKKLGIFFPGQHYTDVKGRPISIAQQEFLDRKDRTGVVVGREPLLGDDISFATSFGFEYIF